MNRIKTPLMEVFSFVLAGLFFSFPAGGNKDKYDNISNNIIYKSKGSGIAFLKFSGETRPGQFVNITGNNIYEIAYSAV